MRRLIAVPALALLLASCQHEAAEAESEAAPPPAPRASAAAAPAAAQTDGAVTVRRANGSQFFAWSEKPSGEIVIDFVAPDGTKGTLRGSPRESGKRKYSVGDGGVLFEVKPGDDLGFKVRMADGKLRWKVKVAADKIKISDNEENKNPFELKTREGDRFKVVAPGDRELGNVRADGAVEDASGKTMFTAAGKKSAAYGVLLLDSIPDLERYIVTAELLSRGR
jgi:hypothetical protein